jgi:hypothetical protein
MKSKIPPNAVVYDAYNFGTNGNWITKNENIYKHDSVNYIFSPGKVI